MSKRTATITFHASHNYGSNLQAYALQQTILKLGYENEIINLRTERQKGLYTVFQKRKKRLNLFLHLIKNLSHLLYYLPLKKSYDKFEYFINNKLILTRKYASGEELVNANLQFDTYIAGSDQIWNPVIIDFDWSYYLSFVREGRKVSYAPSFGQLVSKGNNETMKRISSALKSFDAISVREQGAAENVRQFVGIEPQIVLDPTLLIKKEEWLNLVKDEKRIVEGDYIFFYTLFADPDRMNIVKRVSKETGLPIVISRFSNQYDIFNSFKKCYGIGPLGFLTLIRDAKLVVTSSFHGTAFSTLLNVPFFAIDGMSDARISTLLKIAGLENRVITVNNVEAKCKEAFNIDFESVNARIEDARKPSIEYLKESLEV